MNNEQQTNPFSLPALLEELEKAKKEQVDIKAQTEKNIETLDNTMAEIKKAMGK